LANYKNVISAVHRIINELGIGARRITISTVGIVPIIHKITADSRRPTNHNDTNENNDHSSSGLLPQFRLAISLHSANDEERTALLPANARNGGLNALMEALKEYCDVTGRRITIEWALIAGQNDNIQTAQQLGRLLVRHPQYPLRPDLVHVNVIPLNPTALYDGQPSRPNSVNVFCQTLMNEFGISCTPRVRRGIDIDAGCGQLTTKFRQQQQQQDDEKKNSFDNVNSNVESSLTSQTTATTTTILDFIPPSPQKPVVIGVYNDDEYNDDEEENGEDYNDSVSVSMSVDLDDGDNVMDMVLKNEEGHDHHYKSEADRLISLVQGTTINLSNLDTGSDS
jgi:hypothetical protein